MIEDTAHFTIHENSLVSKNYCSYCGKLCDEKVEWDENDRSTYYFCDCSSAKAELELKEQQRLLDLQKKNRLVVLDQFKIDQIHFDHELKLLRKKYNQ